MITGGFNDWQTEGLEGKNFDRKHSKATFALFANCKWHRGLLVEGNTCKVEQDAISLDEPWFKQKSLLGKTFFSWAGYV